MTHVLSLPLFVLATVHFVLTGTDAGNPFALAGIVICSLAVLGLVVRRIDRSRPAPSHPQPVAPLRDSGNCRISGNLTRDSVRLSPDGVQTEGDATWTTDAGRHAGRD